MSRPEASGVANTVSSLTLEPFSAMGFCSWSAPLVPFSVFSVQMVEQEWNHGPPTVSPSDAHRVNRESNCRLSATVNSMQV